MPEPIHDDALVMIREYARRRSAEGSLNGHWTAEDWESLVDGIISKLDRAVSARPVTVSRQARELRDAADVCWPAAIVHVGDEDDRLRAWNEGYAEALRQVREDLDDYADEEDPDQAAYLRDYAFHLDEWRPKPSKEGVDD